jgi:predicted MFS family arabinose efflux permease
MNTNDHEDIENVTAHAALRAGRREWIGLAVIALPCLLYSMDLTVLELAVPKLSADLRPTSSQLLWILDIYGFLLAGFLITMGTLGDRIGRRRLLLIGAAAFGAASVLAAVLAVIYGLKQVAQDGMGWLPVLSIAAGGAVGIVFVRRQRTLADPLIDLRLFRVPAFSTALATFASSIFVIAGIFLFIAQYLQLVLRLSPLVAGLWTVPSAGGLIAGSMLAPVLVRRVRPAFVMAGGLALSAVGFGMLAQVNAASGLAILVAGSVVLALGVAPVGTLATDIIVGSAPPERAGAASGISETSAELGGALGIAVLGSIGTAVYRSQVADAFPDGVPSEAAEATRDTLGGAVSAADQLPDRVGAGLLDTAREAFTQGLQVTAITSAAIVLGMAILAAVLLRNVRTGSESEGLAGREPDAAIPRSTGVGQVLGSPSAAGPEDCAPGREGS